MISINHWSILLNLKMVNRSLMYMHKRIDETLIAPPRSSNKFTPPCTSMKLFGSLLTNLGSQSTSSQSSLNQHLTSQLKAQLSPNHELKLFELLPARKWEAKHSRSPQASTLGTLLSQLANRSTAFTKAVSTNLRLVDNMKRRISYRKH